MISKVLVSGAAAVASATALLAICGLISLNTGSAVGLPPVAVAFTQGFEDAAYARLVESRSPSNLADARAFAEAALRLSPYANTARLRLAYVDTMSHGHLTPYGAKQFARSYDLMPIDADVAAWRVRFGLEHWEDLPAAARASVHDEALAFWRLGSRDVDMPAVLNTIQDPAGRLAVALWLHSPTSTPR